MTLLASGPALVHLTTLRDKRTSALVYHRIADRLMTYVVALLSRPSAAGDGQSLTDSSLYGIALGTEGLPLLTHFRRMERTMPYGCIRLRCDQTGSPPTRRWIVDRLGLSRRPRPTTRVLLFAPTAAGAGKQLCAGLKVHCVREPESYCSALD